MPLRELPRVHFSCTEVSGHDSICYDQAVTSMWRRNKHFSVMNLVVPFSKTAV